MRKLFITTSIMAALVAGSTMAQEAEKVTIDLDSFCKKGCTVAIKFTDDARIADTRNLAAGEFTVKAEDNPLAYVTALGKTDTGMTEFVLSSEPGAPRFRSIKQVQAYMVGQNALMNRALRLQRQNSGS